MLAAAGPPRRAEQPAMAGRHRGPLPRHLDDAQSYRDGPGPGAQHRQRLPTTTTRRCRPQRRGIRCVARDRGPEHAHDHPRGGGERTQPAPHRRDRPTQTTRDRPMPVTAEHLGLDRRRDHRRTIGPPRRQTNREKHMRGPATAAPGPTRTVSHRARPRQGLPDPPNPGTTPRAQLPAALRAADPAPGQIHLDSRNVVTYRHHQREAYRVRTARRDVPTSHAGPLAYPDIVTLMPPMPADQDPDPRQPHRHPPRRPRRQTTRRPTRG